MTEADPAPVEEREPEPREEAPVDPNACTLCGARLDDDQEWCLECGTPRTIVHSPPDWRAPAAVIALVLVAGLVALAIVLVNLGSPGTTTVPGQTVTVTTPTAATTAKRPAVGRAPSLLTWPPGLSGWTVVLATTTDRATADAAAEQLASTGLPLVGVLDTTQHPRLKPGQFDVFVNRYAAQAEAQAAASTLAAHGHPGGVVREIAAPGGI